MEIKISRDELTLVLGALLRAEGTPYKDKCRILYDKLYEIWRDALGIIGENNGKQ